MHLIRQQKLPLTKTIRTSISWPGGFLIEASFQEVILTRKSYYECNKNVQFLHRNFSYKTEMLLNLNRPGMQSLSSYLGSCVPFPNFNSLPASVNC